MNYCKTAKNVMQLTDLRKSLFLLLSIILFIPLHMQSELSVVKGFDFEYSITGKFKPETFYGKNISLLNNKNSEVGLLSIIPPPPIKIILFS
jgi:hypothetical protein